MPKCPRVIEKNRYFCTMKNIITLVAAMLLALAPAAATGLKGKVIYVNPGHGGWTVNDRPHATVNYESMDTMSFFESKTCLWKALELRDRLKAAGARVIAGLPRATTTPQPTTALKPIATRTASSSSSRSRRLRAR